MDYGESMTSRDPERSNSCTKYA